MRRILDDIARGIVTAPTWGWVLVCTVVTYLILWGTP